MDELAAQAVFSFTELRNAAELRQRERPEPHKIAFPDALVVVSANATAPDRDYTITAELRQKLFRNNARLETADCALFCEHLANVFLMSNYRVFHAVERYPRCKTIIVDLGINGGRQQAFNAITPQLSPESLNFFMRLNLVILGRASDGDASLYAHFSVLDRDFFQQDTWTLRHSAALTSGGNRRPEETLEENARSVGDLFADVVQFVTKTAVVKNTLSFAKLPATLQQLPVGQDIAPELRNLLLSIPMDTTQTFAHTLARAMLHHMIAARPVSIRALATDQPGISSSMWPDNAIALRVETLRTVVPRQSPYLNNEAYLQAAALYAFLLYAFESGIIPAAAPPLDTRALQRSTPRMYLYHSNLPASAFAMAHEAAFSTLLPYPWSDPTRMQSVYAQGQDLSSGERIALSAAQTEQPMSSDPAVPYEVQVQLIDDVAQFLFTNNYYSQIIRPGAVLPGGAILQLLHWLSRNSYETRIEDVQFDPILLQILSDARRSVLYDNTDTGVFQLIPKEGEGSIGFNTLLDQVVQQQLSERRMEQNADDAELRKILQVASFGLVAYRMFAFAPRGTLQTSISQQLPDVKRLLSRMLVAHIVRAGFAMQQPALQQTYSFMIMQQNMWLVDDVATARTQFLQSVAQSLQQKVPAVGPLLLGGGIETSRTTGAQPSSTVIGVLKEILVAEKAPPSSEYGSEEDDAPNWKGIMIMLNALLFLVERLSANPRELQSFQQKMRSPQNVQDLFKTLLAMFVTPQGRASNDYLDRELYRFYQE